jgi:hypothetical protein
MDQDREKAAVKERLDRCWKLAQEFQEGPTAKHIREIEAALLDDLRALEASDAAHLRRQGPRSIP